LGDVDRCKAERSRGLFVRLPFLKAYSQSFPERAESLSPGGHVVWFKRSDGSDAGRHGSQLVMIQDVWALTEGSRDLMAQDFGLPKTR
jgi:hypothetical protein